MPKKSPIVRVLQIILFPLFVVGLLYRLLELIWLIILCTIVYGIFIIWLIKDPTFSLDKLAYFVGFTLFFLTVYYLDFIYSENKIQNKHDNPINEDLTNIK